MANPVISIIAVSLCDDCLMVAANGDCGDLPVPEECSLGFKREELAGGRVIPGCILGHVGNIFGYDACNRGAFSWSPCDICGSPLGGQRYPGSVVYSKT